MVGETPLSELCDAVVDCPHSTPVWTDSGAVVLRSQNIRNGRLDLSSPSYTDEVHFRNRTKRALPREGDLVITREAPMGEVCMIPKDLRCCLGQRMVLLRPNRLKTEPRFLLYALQSKAVQREIGVNEGTGSTVSNLRIPLLEALPIPAPPLTEQRAIAHILGTLDDKIELNRRMNKTLEAMARALFKSWFVDFDPVRAKAEGRDPGLPEPLADLFPDSFEDSELGAIPKGWKVSPLGGLADLDKGLSYKGEHLAGEGGLPMVNLGCFSGGGQFNAEKLKRYRGEYRERHVVQVGDLVIANTDVTQDRVILGSPAIVPESGGERSYLFSHHTFAFRFKEGSEQWRRFVYFVLLQSGFREIAEGYATGTTVLALPRNGVLDYSVALPPVPLLAAFERQIDGWLSSANLMRRQSRVLGESRDTLLPKLISGELRVPLRSAS